MAERAKQLKIEPAKSDRHEVGEDARLRKQTLLTHGSPSVTSSIANALVLKSGDLFLVTREHGGVPADERNGFGLFHRDCRFLSGYEVLFGGESLEPLVATDEAGSAVVELCNRHIAWQGSPVIEKQQIGIRWDRALDVDSLELQDKFTIRNFGHTGVVSDLSFTFAADFRDVFCIRGLLEMKPGEDRPPVWNNDELCFSYQGADGYLRTTAISFSERPVSKERNGATFHVDIPAEDMQVLQVRVKVSAEHDSRPTPSTKDNLSGHQPFPLFSSDSISLNRIMQRSERDLKMLRSHINGDAFVAAGVPWFATLFGRDSAIAALQTLAFDSGLASETLRLLASLQGKHVDAWRDEQPGKILHELRVGELARLHEIPHTPYYGSVDATPLFLILLARHAAWTGSTELFEELKENVESALHWIDNYGDLDGDGLVEYDSTSDFGLINQGWKDSGDAIVDDRGELAVPPIALIEVQAYVALAKREMASLFEHAGDRGRAARLRNQAEELRKKINQVFWLEDKNFYAMALDGDKRPLRVLSSNPGHLLWTGFADPEKAKAVAHVLMQPDMFSGWGVRTLSTNERRYNPIGYHLGTVWPHDNGIIACGLRSYGYHDEFEKIFTGMLRAATYFPSFRLPEVFAGFPAEDYGVPVQYPVACHPQAWAAGTVPHMLQSAMGLKVADLGRVLRIEKPLMPRIMDRLQIQDLHVGRGTVSLRFTRKHDNVPTVEVEKAKGIEVQVEQH